MGHDGLSLCVGCKGRLIEWEWESGGWHSETGQENGERYEESSLCIRVQWCESSYSGIIC